MKLLMGRVLEIIWVSGISQKNRHHQVIEIFRAGSCAIDFQAESALTLNKTQKVPIAHDPAHNDVSKFQNVFDI